ncbi:hypothetical protein B0H65DRAFT_21341 [Neurospora tetraspora]|uniref:Uncharacterized protein n=1 Tax=Neurospora tetraspora TaxID=94610 RepID=A0AAE0MVQ4_9PEZI|nr:hypothetical protein B0H65DRAFT_21341 [Neurospora tetraspora]
MHTLTDIKHHQQNTTGLKTTCTSRAILQLLEPILIHLAPIRLPPQRFRGYISRADRETGLLPDGGTDHQHETGTRHEYVMRSIRVRELVLGRQEERREERRRREESLRSQLRQTQEFFSDLRLHGEMPEEQRNGSKIFPSHSFSQSQTAPQQLHASSFEPRSHPPSLATLFRGRR